MISTSEKDLSILEAVAQSKELMELESGFRQLKDVLALRPSSHQVEPRVKAHIFVAALALLVHAGWADGSRTRGWSCRLSGRF